jgi:hypothetical protein
MSTLSSHPPSPSVKERKVSQSASCKIDSIIKQLFLPMLGMPTPEKTSFQPDDDTLIRQVAEECPAALACETDFVDYMVVLYRKFQKDERSERSERLLEGNPDKCVANSTLDFAGKRLHTLVPTAAQPVKALQLPVQILEDGADLPKALSHAVDASACVGELHHLCAGL